MAKTKIREILNSEDTTKEKIDYLWGYYHWHVVIAVIVVSLLAFITVDAFNRTETTFHVTVFAAEVSFLEEEALINDLNDLLEPESEKESAYVSFTPQGRMVEGFLARLAAAEYDLILMDNEAYEQYSELGAMLEFRLTGLPEEDYYQPDGHDDPIGIDSSQLPIFDGYETTKDTIVMIPENTRRRETVKDFFETQGYEIEFIDQD
ncbi:hypothetical protein ACO1PF_09885 [Alkalibacterium sp. f15]|uniref:hypothetical protein n=1 Tax=Alkalibacterium sp. f15 TaxID=3414029 RepID=UPI003BF868A9